MVQQATAPPLQITPQLQERLARVSEQFGTKINVGKVSDEEDEAAAAEEHLYVEPVVKNYSQKKYSAEVT